MRYSTKFLLIPRSIHSEFKLPSTKSKCLNTEQTSNIAVTSALFALDIFLMAENVYSTHRESQYKTDKNYHFPKVEILQMPTSTIFTQKGDLKVCVLQTFCQMCHWNVLRIVWFFETKPEHITKIKQTKQK